MEFSVILNWILTGGMIGLVIAIATLRSKIRQAEAEAEEAKANAQKAEAEAEGVKITNAENATRILIDNIVKPLKEHLHAVEEELALLREAIKSATSCRFSNNCVVLQRLRRQPEADQNDDRSGNRSEPDDSYSHNGNNRAHGIRGDPQ